MLVAERRQVSLTHGARLMLLRTFQPGSMGAPSVTRSAAPAGG